MEGLASSLGVNIFRFDANQPEEIEYLFSTAQEKLGPISGVVNCVGSVFLKPAHLTTDTEWSDTLASNLTSALLAVRSGVRAMRTQGGSIVLISSPAARTGLPNHEALAAAKAGVIGLTLSTAASYAPYNVRINCVAPGLVRTSMTDRITENPASLKAALGMHPLGRIGQPVQVASAVAWLLDDIQD